MSDKSGVSDQVMSLPSGGGALKGTGGKFSTRKQTGSASYTMPIDVPDGRNGLQPDLNLAYSSGNGDGRYGLGWALGVPSISRKTKTGVPVYDDGEDTFLLGGKDLVQVDQYDESDGTRVTRYRPRIESEFARIEHHRSPSTDHWIVEAKDETRRRYGTPDSVGSDPATVADPSDRTRVFKWYLTETVDTHGNRIEYEYARDTGETDQHHWDQLYLDAISYVDYEDESGRSDFLVTVEFEYEPRPEPIASYTSGFEIRTRKRGSRIIVRTHADRDRPIRSYELTYADELAGESTPRNGASQLTRIQVVGHDDGDTQRLPPVQLSYSQFDPEGRDFESLSGPVPSQSLSAPEIELADLFGNGLPDIVEIDDEIRYWRNLGDGEFDEPRPMDESPVGLSLADTDVQLMDVDGDGRIDLVTFDTPLSGYFPLNRDGGWAESSFQAFEGLPSVNLDAPNVQMTDLTGDGVTDIVRTSEQFECFFQDREKGWTETRTVTGGIDGLKRVDFSDPRLRLADCCGDGLQDIVMIDDGHVSYWPNRGYADWGRRVRMDDPPNLPRGHDPGRILLGDIDGDGLTDLVYVEDDRVRVWMNQCGNSWSEPYEITGTPTVTDTDAVRLVDIEGDGIGGLLYSDGGRAGSDEMYFLNLIGDRKPYLLTESRNNMGATTRIKYAPSTAFYLQSEREGEGWKTTLPQPTWVVERVENVDEISGGRETTEYTYHHGHYDGVEREYRGFGMVEQSDSESFESYTESSTDADVSTGRIGGREQFSPPSLTRTWFELGPAGRAHGDWREIEYTNEYWDGDSRLIDRPAETERLLDRLKRRDRRDAVRALQGRPIRTEVYARDGASRDDRPYTVSERAYGLRQESAGDSGDDRRTVFYPYQAQSRETSWERGEDPKTTITVVGDYDRYGQPQNTIEIAAPQGWEPGAATDGYLVTQERSRFAYRRDDTHYLVDRLAAKRAYEIEVERDRTVDELLDAIADDEVTRRLIGLTRHFYDGEAFEGLSLGELGDYGNRVRTTELVLTNEIIADVYPGGDNPPAAGPPSYLTADAPTWSSAYPTEFRDGMAERAGYVVRQDLPDATSATTGYFATTYRAAYDVQQPGRNSDRGLLVATQDPLGNETTLASYDPYDLTPTEVIDPAGLSTTTTYDYAAMKQRETTDPNGNRTRNEYNPLGKVKSVANLGKQGEQNGDTPDQPSKRFVYHFRAFERSPPANPEPAYVHAIERTRHAFDVIEQENERRRERGESELTEADIEELFPRDPTADIPERPEIEQYPERFQQSREYSDGFGRIVQSQSQAETRIYGEDGTFGKGVLSLDQSDLEAHPVTVHEVNATKQRVRVSGWETFDNKGNVVEEYEPFFRVSEGWDFLSRSEAATSNRETIGRHTDTYYDPLGREVRSVYPDGSESRSIRGSVPEDSLNDPDAYEPTPWEVFEYDANDNAGRTHPGESGEYDHHWNTPTSRRYDPLGRVIETVERNRTSDDATIERVQTEREYDIRGNVVSVTDQLGRTAFKYGYDLANNELRSETRDRGTKRIVLDAAGNELERRDAKGALECHRYDLKNRVTHAWGRDATTESVTLRRRVYHGETDDTLSAGDARDRNILGRVNRSYDEAGRVQFEAYDFKGNPQKKQRRVLDDDAVTSDVIDWTPVSGSDVASRERDLLASGTFRLDMEYDALGRVRRRRLPADESGDRKEFRMSYNRGGALERVDLASNVATEGEQVDSYVECIGYDAGGDRTLIAYGNGVMTRYAYDDRTQRLRRQLTQPYETTASGGYEPDTDASSVVLQDFGYEYDRVGNVRTIADRTPNSGVRDTPDGVDALEREFEYDTLNRLTKATGRETSNMPRPRPWGDTSPTTDQEQRYGVPDVTRTNAPDQTALYEETYQYDAAGNLTKIGHAGASDWSRTFGIGGTHPREWTSNGWASTPANNRVTHVRDPNGHSMPTHTYDKAGNLLTEQNATFGWDYRDRLRYYEEAAGDGPPSVTASYAYDAGGQRVKKVIEKQGQTEVTVYIDGIFEYRSREFDSDGREARANNTIHVMDDTDRVALVRVGSPLDPSDPTPSVRYQHSDHLDSSTLVVDDDGDWVDYEEFTPFGATAFGGYARKRYRFTGKERDEESGLYYHGQRYYAPWLVRWTTTDPKGTTDGLNTYSYVKNNPLRATDPTGTSSEYNEANKCTSDENKAMTKSSKASNAAEEYVKQGGKSTLSGETKGGRCVLQSMKKKESLYRHAELAATLVSPTDTEKTRDVGHKEARDHAKQMSHEDGKSAHHADPPEDSTYKKGKPSEKVTLEPEQTSGGKSTSKSGSSKSSSGSGSKSSSGKQPRRRICRETIKKRKQAYKKHPVKARLCDAPENLVDNGESTSGGGSAGSSSGSGGSNSDGGSGKSRGGGGSKTGADSGGGASMSKSAKRFGKTTLKAVGPDAALFVLDYMARRNLDRAQDIRQQSGRPTKEEIEINEEQGYQYKGTEEGQAQWEFDPPWYIGLRNGIMFLVNPPIDKMIRRRPMPGDPGYQGPI
ncbi:SpvB/TcaC N-terminal domain-containing protein [Salinirubellus sp. GCM10025818]|uniref:SpvB/TcaC N-terminal domain-containing protein n=1 Tax=Salinirubellus TaxID=2162630 RepID=UPI0030CD6FA1